MDGKLTGVVLLGCSWFPPISKTQTFGDGFRPRDNFICRGIRLITERKRPSGRQGQRNGSAQRHMTMAKRTYWSNSATHPVIRLLHRRGQDRGRPSLGAHPKGRTTRNSGSNVGLALFSTRQLDFRAIGSGQGAIVQPGRHSARDAASLVVSPIAGHVCKRGGPLSAFQ
jgi:hypothetical protein